MSRDSTRLEISVEETLCKILVEEISAFPATIEIQLLEDGWYRAQIFAGYDAYVCTEFLTLEEARQQVLTWINSELGGV